MEPRTPAGFSQGLNMQQDFYAGSKQKRELNHLTLGIIRRYV